jgi:NADPH-dependent 2,4-dienoyl-CoA reductase/sulfur reductase-like enzyme
MLETHTHKHTRVVIAGGGIAAIEALLALRSLCGRRIELTLISPERELLYRPLTVAEAFDRARARTDDLSDIFRDQVGGRIVWAALVEVDAEHQSVVTSDGERIQYDVLVVATGAAARDPLAGARTSTGVPTCPRSERCLASSPTVVPARSRWSSRRSGCGRCQSTGWR